MCKSLDEESLIGWTNTQKYPQSTITAKRGIPAGGAKLAGKTTFDIPEGKIAITVKSAKVYGKWDDRPGYKPKSLHRYNPRDFMDMKGGKSIPYVVTIQFDQWGPFIKDFLRTHKSNREIYNIFKNKYHMIVFLLKNANVKFDCTCPAFYWQGFLAELQTVNAAIRTDNVPRSTSHEKTFPKEGWVALHRKLGAKPPYIVCKHIYAVLKDLKDPGGYLLRKTYTEMDKAVVLDDIHKKVIAGLPSDAITQD